MFCAWHPFVAAINKGIKSFTVSSTFPLRRIYHSVEFGFSRMFIQAGDGKIKRLVHHSQFSRKISLKAFPTREKKPYKHWALDLDQPEEKRCKNTIKVNLRKLPNVHYPQGLSKPFLLPRLQGCFQSFDPLCWVYSGLKTQVTKG